MGQNMQKKPRALTATGPDQIYSWDITYLPTAVKGIFLYLYLVMDIYSRKIYVVSKICSRNCIDGPTMGFEVWEISAKDL